MYIVTDDYKEQIRYPLRNPSSVKVIMDIENSDANDDATLTAPADPNATQHVISNVAVLNNEYFINDRIGTLELNRFVLDGESSIGLYPDPEIYQGYMSSIPSSAFNVWTTAPYITIQFSNLQVLDGLSFVFDSLLYGHPTDMRIEVFNGATPVLDTHVYPDNYEWTYDTPLPPCTKIILTPQATNIRYWRFRIEDIIFGIVKEFDPAIITNCNWKREVDLVDAKLPTFNFDFTFIDINNEFNPDDDTSLYRFLDDRQRVRFYFGYELDSGTIEWVKGSEYFTTGDITVDSNSGINTVSLKSSSRLYFLTQEYTEGKFLNNPWSLHAMLSLIIEFMGINALYTDYSYIISDFDALSVQSTSPLPNLPINQCLQLIANAGLCLLDIDREGRIVIKPRPVEAQDFALTFSDMMKPPVITKYPKLQGVDTAINFVSKEPSASTILTKSVTGASSTLYEFTYDNYTDVVVTLSGTLVFSGSQEIYDNLARVRVTGTGDITITGKALVLSEQLYSYEYQTLGERCPVKNQLISTEAHAHDFALWIADYASCSNQYDIEDRGFPELDMADNITFDTLLSKNLYGTVFYNEISYNGALKGKTKVLMAKNMFTTIVNKSGTFNCGQDLILPTGYNK